MLGLLQVQATPQNLYEQLCEINQEWHKNRAIAESMGFLNLPPIAGEQNILSFHIKTLWQIFRNRDASALSPTQQQARANNLRNLSEYAQLRDCPRNYYLPYRNPVFIDHEGRYCAVGYLMKQTGKQAFCEAVQQASNFIFVRQINHPEFHAWQHESGLSLDELAWIQPAYSPALTFIEWDRRDANGKLIVLDSVRTKKIYRFVFPNAFDKTKGLNIDGLSDTPEDLNTKLKELNPAYAKAHKPDWEKFRVTGFHLKAMTMFKKDLYIAVDSMWIVYDKQDSTQYEYKNRYILYKWDKKNAWTKVSELDVAGDVHCLIEIDGKLYMGGGKDIGVMLDKEANGFLQYFTSSFLASFDGKEWTVSQEEYGGIVVGMMYIKGKRYLATLYNEWSFPPAPINQPKKVEAMSEGGK
jgi:hypothetical protein